MSFLNQDINEKYCGECRYKTASYMNRYGVYSPCLDCIDGGNMVADAEICDCEGGPDLGSITYCVACGKDIN